MQGAPSWRELDQEIRNNRPVGAELLLIGGSAHFVAIVETGAQGRIVYCDPSNRGGPNGRTTVRLQQLARSAHSLWRETYFTNP